MNSKMREQLEKLQNDMLADAAMMNDPRPFYAYATRIQALLASTEQEGRLSYDDAIESVQEAIGNWGGPEREHYTQAMHRVIDALKKREQGLDLWGTPAAAPADDLAIQAERKRKEQDRELIRKGVKGTLEEAALHFERKVVGVFHPAQIAMILRSLDQPAIAAKLAESKAQPGETK